MGVIRLPEYRAPPPGRRCTPHSSFCRPCRRPAKSKRLLRNLAIPSCVRVSWAVRIIPVRLQCCSGVAMVLFPWVSLGYPLGIPWVSLVHPLYIPCTSLVHPLYIPCTSLVHPLYIPCTSLVHPLYIPCTSLVHPLYIPCTSLVHPLY